MVCSNASSDDQTVLGMNCLQKNLIIYYYKCSIDVIWSIGTYSYQSYLGNNMIVILNFTTDR